MNRGWETRKKKLRTRVSELDGIGFNRSEDVRKMWTLGIVSVVYKFYSARSCQGSWFRTLGLRSWLSADLILHIRISMGLFTGFYIIEVIKIIANS